AAAGERRGLDGSGPLLPPDQADARGEPRDAIRFGGSHLRAQMGRDEGHLLTPRPAAAPEPPDDVHRVAVPGPAGTDEAARDPRRRDRRDVGREAELREAAGTGTPRHKDPP